MNKNIKENKSLSEILYDSNLDKYMFDNNTESILRFLDVPFKEKISANMINLIIKTLNDLYISRGIIRNDPKTWINVEWPTISDLYKYWEYLLEKEPKNKSLESLVSRMKLYNDYWN